MTATKAEAPLTGLALLRQPFAPHQISKLPKPMKKREDMDKLPKAKCAVCGGYHATSMVMHLDYVGHAALTDRLLDTDINWSWEPVAFGPDGLPATDRSGGMWIKLTVLGVTRLGYGSAEGKTGGDAVKEIIGDALRNAAMRFGAALDLWHKGDLHGPDEEAGKPSSEAEEPKEPTLSDRADLFLGALNKVTSRVDLEAAWAKGSKVCAALSTADPDKLDAITRRYEARRAEFIAADKPADDDSFPGDSTPFDREAA